MEKVESSHSPNGSFSGPLMRKPWSRPSKAASFGHWSMNKHTPQL